MSKKLARPRVLVSSKVTKRVGSAEFLRMKDAGALRRADIEYHPAPFGSKNLGYWQVTYDSFVLDTAKPSYGRVKPDTQLTFTGPAETY